MKHIRMALLLFAAISLFPRLTAAGCISDCRDEYESERQHCVTMYDDPDDADDLQTCLRNAREEYETCVEDCRS